LLLLNILRKVIFLKLAILTGGGDCQGENSCLYAATSTARRLGIEIVGLRNGWAGAIDYFEKPLYEHVLRDYITRAGTWIGTSRTNPFEEGNDRSDEIIRNFEKHNIDALIAVGGEDTLGAALKLLHKYPKIVGVAKTMDNDLQAPYCLGFNSAVENARSFIYQLTTSAYSHDRVIVCEVFGRHVGWVALKSGITTNADLILIPEVKADMDVSCEDLRNRMEERRKKNEFEKTYGIVVVAEGVNFGENSNKKMDSFGHKELTGVGERVARYIEDTFENKYNAPVEIKHARPESAIRGGNSSWFDIDMGLKYGAAAVKYAFNGKFGLVPTVDLKTENIEPMHLLDVITQKNVPAYLLQFYENVVSFGRAPK